MAKQSRKCSLHKKIDANDAIQMMDDFIEKRVHLIGYDIDDIDDLDIEDFQKQNIKNALKNNFKYLYKEYMGNGLYRVFYT